MNRLLEYLSKIVRCKGGRGERGVDDRRAKKFYQARASGNEEFCSNICNSKELHVSLDYHQFLRIEMDRIRCGEAMTGVAKVFARQVLKQ